MRHTIPHAPLFYFNRYLNLGSYKKNPNHQNTNTVQKNGSNQTPVMPGTSMKTKNEKLDDPDKAKRTYISNLDTLSKKSFLIN